MSPEPRIKMADNSAPISDDRSDLETSIAEGLGELSEGEVWPTEVTPPPAQFTAAEVDFSSDTWWDRLTDVQGWLRLDSPIDGTTRESQLDSLVGGLELDPTRDVDRSKGTPQLTDAVLESLRARVDRARSLKLTFLADMDADEASLKDASGRWIQAWDEAVEQEEGSEPVNAKADVWTIQDFANKARFDRLNLSPPYQRSDVWANTDSQLLIDSILRGIPLPSIIILKPQAGLSSKYEVVDGKQRLTAMLRFMGKHPSALKKVQEEQDNHPSVPLRHLFETNYPNFRTAWKNTVGESLTTELERKYHFPFKVRPTFRPGVSALDGLRGKYYTQIVDSPLQFAGTTGTVREVFEGSEYKIPVVEYVQATPRQIHEVFNLYNKQGKHLNAEEIRNAVFQTIDLAPGLLVAAGDTDPMNQPDVAPFLRPDWDALGEISGHLAKYGFGDQRYRRTKILTWLTAMLLLDSTDADTVSRRSTANQSNELLRRIQDDNDHAMRSHARIRDLLMLLREGIQAHNATTWAWDASFRSKPASGKWQELQLVGSVLGVTIAASVLGKNTMERLNDAADDLLEKTASAAWQRPGKTQTKTQWTYIAHIALGIVEAMQVTPGDAELAVSARFGTSGVESLRRVRQEDQEREERERRDRES